MRTAIWLLAGVGVISGNLLAATIGFQVSTVGTTSGGQTLYRYTYSVSDFTFQANQELDIRFDPALYGTLSNGVAPVGFDLLLIQPNNPPGTTGDYSALTMVSNPAMSPFSVDFTFIGPGTPGSQPYFINQYSQNGSFVTIASGFTVPQGQAVVPEPATFALAGAQLLAIGAVLAVRRRKGRFGRTDLQ